MKTKGMVLMVLMAAAANGAGADVLTVAPSRAVVLPADGSGLTKVAVQFDLSGMREGEGRKVDEAKVEWTPPGVPSDAYVEFSAYAATESWTAAIAAQGGPEVAETAVGTWDIDPADHARGGGLVRLDVRKAAAGWVSGATANHGLVLVLGELDGEGLESALGQIRLVIHYGFSR